MSDSGSLTRFSAGLLARFALVGVKGRLLLVVSFFGGVALLALFFFALPSVAAGAVGPSCKLLSVVPPADSEVRRVEDEESRGGSVGWPAATSPFSLASETAARGVRGVWALNPSSSRFSRPDGVAAEDEGGRDWEVRESTSVSRLKRSMSIVARFGTSGGAIREVNAGEAGRRKVASSRGAFEMLGGIGGARF